jgi:hypothetical protein
MAQVIVDFAVKGYSRAKDQIGLDWLVLIENFSSVRAGLDLGSGRTRNWSVATHLVPCEAKPGCHSGNLELALLGGRYRVRIGFPDG